MSPKPRKLTCPECKYKITCTPGMEVVKCPDCLTRVDVSGKRGRALNEKFTPTYHHAENYLKETSVVEIEVSEVVITANQVQCLLCSHFSDQITSLAGEILKEGSFTKTEEVEDPVTHELHEVKRKISFPRYVSGFVCSGCAREFTSMCSTYDPKWKRLQGKLKYVALPESTLAEDIVLPISTTREYHEAMSDVPDDQVAEVVDVVRVAGRGMSFKSPDDLTDSAYERAEERDKSNRLRPTDPMTERKSRVNKSKNTAITRRPE